MSEETELETDVDTALSMIEMDYQQHVNAQTDSLSYYHGFLSYTDTILLLKKKGDFLMRLHKVEDGRRVIVISVRTTRKLVVQRLLLGNRHTGHVFFDEHEEPSIAELIEWHRSTGTRLIYDKPNLIIERAIHRPKWQLDENPLTSPIRTLGTGFFGDIYLAEYEGKNGKQRVTVEELSRQDDRFNFMNLARWMRKNNRKNEIKIVGIFILYRPMVLVLEINPNDSIKETF